MTSDIAKRKTGKGALMAHIAAFVVVTMWGYSFVSSRQLLDNGLGPVQIYILRFLLAYLVVLVMCHRHFRAANLREEGMFALCGLFAGSLYFIAENTALEYTMATNVALITSLSPLITVLLVALVYRTEQPGLGTWIGSALAIAGVTCVVFNGNSEFEFGPIGDMLSLGAAFSWAIYSLVLRRLNANYDIWFVTRKTFFYGLVTAIPFLFFEQNDVALGQVIGRPAVWGNLLFLGLGASTLAYLLWALSVKELGAVKANNYLYLQSIVTLIVSAMVLDERVTVMGYLGVFLIIAGLWSGDNINKIIQRHRS